MRRLTPFLTLLLALMIAPLAQSPLAPVASAAQNQALVAAQLTQLPDYTEKESQSASDNGTIEAAERIDSASIPSWSRTISGTIDSSSDIDYYRLTLSAPASAITITMTGPEADYDLVLGGGVDTSQTEIVSDTYETGLEQVTQIGGSISSIGGSISSISANANTASEAIGTLLWLPGEYYIVVTTSSGQFSKTQNYTLDVQLEASGLSKPPPAPEVRAQLFSPFGIASTAITTLYIYHSGRMGQLYPGEKASADAIPNQLANLASLGPSINNGPAEYGVVVNLAELFPISGTSTITDVYALWDSPTNRSNPLYANYIAGLIDNVVEAVINGGNSGPNPKYQLGNATGPVSFPNIRNVVLVGGDDMIPYYRLPDLTTIANEADYATYLKSLDASGIIRSDSPQGAALRYRMLLTDSPYGSDKPYRFYGFPFFVPRLAVGRLVETPAQIRSFLSGYEFGSIADFQIDATRFGQPDGPTRAFVNGYDFLKDEAGAIYAILRDTGLAPDEINQLINDTWNRSDLAQQWFDGVLDADLPEGGNVGDSSIPDGAQIDLSSVNAHFDHWQLLPANDPDGSKGQTFPALRVLNTNYPVRGEPPPYYVGTLGYSVGCHSGYNVLNSSLPTNLSNFQTYAADFAQAFNWHGGNWVGNTGYGYGTADGIDYSERLAVLYTQELVRATPTISISTIGASVGEALVKAKQRYVRNSASLTAYDYKVVNIMTFYGLPFLRMIVTNPLAPPAEEPQPNDPGATPQETTAPTAPNNLGRLTRTLTFTIAVDASDFKPVPRTDSTLFDLDPADFTVVDEFDQLDGSSTVFRQQVRTFSNNQVGVPTLPTFAYDIGATSNDGSERLKVLDVVFVSGTYSGTSGFDPQVTQVVTETETTTPITSRDDEPNFAAGAGFWYPDKFFGYSSVGQGDNQRDQLTAFAAQFRADPDGTRGLLRPYTQMVFKVFYDDPSVSNAEADALDLDTEAPTITSVALGSTGGGVNAAASGQTVITVTVDGVNDDGPDPGLAQVTAILLTGGKNWVPVTFNKTGPGVYVSTPLDVKSAAARFIVRATDKAGNTTYYTAKGQFTPITVLSLPFVRR